MKNSTLDQHALALANASVISNTFFSIWRGEVSIEENFSVEVEKFYNDILTLS
jgi:hypothetical protein